MNLWFYFIAQLLTLNMLPYYFFLSQRILLELTTVDHAIYIKSSVSPTPKRGGSPIKVNQDLCLPHTKKKGSPSKVNRVDVFPTP